MQLYLLFQEHDQMKPLPMLMLISDEQTTL
jgi:hypothetical protein